MRSLRFGSESVVAGPNGLIDRLPDYRDPVKPRACPATVGTTPNHKAKAPAN
jgi:hypothetical protein